MTTIREICEHVEQLAPSRLAEDWDNVGLLVGDDRQPARRVMTCLTVTPTTAREAIEESVDLIVTHHPMPFRSLKRLTAATTVGKLLWDLIGNQVSVCSPHTAWDSAKTGINQRLAEGLGLTDIQPLEPFDEDLDALGRGRYGSLPDSVSLSEMVKRTKSFLSVDGLHVVGDEDAPIRRVAVACGSAGQFLAASHQANCDLMLTGETTFHTCLEAESLGISLILPGHFASEHFSLDCLAAGIAESFPGIQVWASRTERDPLRWE